MLSKKEVIAQGGPSVVLAKATKIIGYALAGIVGLAVGLGAIAAVTEHGVVPGFRAVGLTVATAGYAGESFRVPAIGTTAAVLGVMWDLACCSLLVVIAVRVLRRAFARRDESCTGSTDDART